MRKLIHSSFELDLSNFKISDTEENNWFSDSFFTKYSFPFEIDLEKDLDIAFGFISQYNSSSVETYYECKYVHNNKIEDAIFEIESHQDKLSCTLRFGFEQLPSFDKKLSELSLVNFKWTTSETIQEHAETIITQTWPDVDYNFPQIHTDKYSVEEDDWEFFQGIINNRISGAFLENTIEDDVSYNRNIMQPMPYVLHILQRGMIDAGYTLSGGILEDTRLQKAVVFASVDYFKKQTDVEPIDAYVVYEDAVASGSEQATGTFTEVFAFNNRPPNVYVNPYFNYKQYSYEAVLPIAGKYGLTGKFRIYSIVFKTTYFRIKYRGTVIYERIIPARTTYEFGSSHLWFDYDVDFTFETVNDLDPHSLVFESYQHANSEGGDIIDISIYNIYAYSPGDLPGEPSPSIKNEKKIDLTKSVPDMTFGDFIKVIKNWFNYDLEVSGELAIMNPIESQINYNDAIDMQFSQVKTPLRKFTKGISFLLKFSEIENKDYNYLPVFHNQKEVLNSGYVTDEKTETIDINALPLPLVVRNEVQTAYALEDNDAKVYIVCYDGIYNANNLAKPNIDYLLPEVHLQSWKNWFNFRINSVGFNWDFKSWAEKVVNLKVKTKIYAYNKVHIIKTINKTEIQRDLFEYDIETEALE